MGFAEELDEVSTRYTEALRCGDFEAAAAFYTHDAEIFVAAGTILRGREAIQQSFEIMISEAREVGRTFEGLITLWYDQSGDSASAIQMVEDGSLTLMIALRRDEQAKWLIAREVFVAA